jgi:hypothetical protein
VATQPNLTGFQPRNTPAERRAFFDLVRRVQAIEAGSGGGPTPGGLGFVFVQATPATTWSIDHGLTFIPNVTVVDSAGDEVIGDIEYVSSTTVVCRFAAAFSGTAYLS